MWRRDAGAAFPIRTLCPRPPAMRIEPDPCRRRRPRRLRGRLADRRGRRAGGAARDAARGRHLRPPDRRAGRAGLLQLLPLRRRRAERRRAAALGDAPRPAASSSPAPTGTPCPPAARSPSTGCRSRPRSPPGSKRTRCVTHRARRGRRAAAGRLVERHRRHRPADLAGARRGDPAPHRRDGPRLLRRHRADRALRDRRSDQGLVPVALRQGRDRGGAHRLPELPDGPRRSTRPSSTRCSPPTRPSSRTGRRTRPISRAACRSR